MSCPRSDRAFSHKPLITLAFIQGKPLIPGPAKAAKPLILLAPIQGKPIAPDLLCNLIKTRPQQIKFLSAPIIRLNPKPKCNLAHIGLDKDFLFEKLIDRPSYVLLCCKSCIAAPQIPQP